jgi:hypothetical protein
MAMKNALELLDSFCAEGLAIEVTHRSKRRLFGLAGLGRSATRFLRRADLDQAVGGDGTRNSDGRAAVARVTPAIGTPDDTPSKDGRSTTANARRREEAMAHLELTVRDTRRSLDALARGEPVSAASSSGSGTGVDDGVAGEQEDRL